MSDYQTVRELVAVELHEDATDIEDEINLAIADALFQLRNERLWFNIKSGTLDTVADDYDYTVTSQVADFFYILADEAYVRINNDLNNQVIIPQISNQEWERKFTAYADSTKSYPQMFAMNGATMKVLPTPDGVHRIAFRYIADLGTPRGSYNGSVWSFTEYVSGSAVNTDTFTNEWFTAGQNLLVNYACMLLCRKGLTAPERAPEFEYEKNRILDELRAQESNQASTGRIRGYYG